MKKLMALVLAVVMAVSIAVIPTSAAVHVLEPVTPTEPTTTVPTTTVPETTEPSTEEKEETEEVDLIGLLEGIFAFASDLYDSIHALVGGILSVFDKECPFCDEIHEIAVEEDEEEETTAPEEETTKEPIVIEPSTEPTTEETTTQVPTTEETTTQQPTTEETTTQQPTTEETTTQAPTTEEPTTQAPAETYETYGVRVSNSVLAQQRDFSYTSTNAYPQYVDMAIYLWNRGYVASKVTIKNMATNTVKAAVVISEESVGVNQIVFAGTNNFHSNGGNFKLIVNNSDIPVKVTITGTVTIGSTVVTDANVGNYIVGPYTVA